MTLIIDDLERPYTPKQLATFKSKLLDQPYDETNYRSNHLYTMYYSDKTTRLKAGDFVHVVWHEPNERGNRIAIHLDLFGFVSRLDLLGFVSRTTRFHESRYGVRVRPTQWLEYGIDRKWLDAPLLPEDDEISIPFYWGPLPKGGRIPAKGVTLTRIFESHL
jgi:hypothetical protein